MQVMLADPQTEIRSWLKVGLTHAGLVNNMHTGTLEGVADAMEQSIGSDILICEMGLGDGQVMELTSNVCHNDLGKNPFLCVIFISWESLGHRAVITGTNSEPCFFNGSS